MFPSGFPGYQVFPCKFLFEGLSSKVATITNYISYRKPVYEPRQETEGQVEGLRVEKKDTFESKAFFLTRFFSVRRIYFILINVDNPKKIKVCCLTVSFRNCRFYLRIEMTEDFKPHPGDPPGGVHHHDAHPGDHHPRRPPRRAVGPMEFVGSIGIVISGSFFLGWFILG